MAFKELLMSNLNARKIFGKKEIEIIIKQLEGKDLTQSERNRLSRDIRKKFSFIKEISKFCSEFDLKKNQENNKKIEKALKVILSDELKEEIKAVFLFGSFSDKTFTARSDIDICVVFKKDISLHDATLFRKRILSEVDNKIDVQVFNVLPVKVKKDIARNHKVLYIGNNFSNIDFSIKYLKDNDYFIRREKIFGEV